MYRTLMPIYWITILGLPVTIAAIPAFAVEPLWLKAVSLFVAPIVFGLLHVATCGLLSWPHRTAIQQGEFTRDVANTLYCRRRLYGLGWTAVYYFTPLYNVVLSVPILKRIAFRLFGYGGSLNFTTYADTWLRDLPLLEFGPGAYLANKSTVGTNLYSLKTKKVLVGPVSIGAEAILGHLAIIGFGAYIAEQAELGMGSMLGLGASLGARTRTGPACAINHMAQIGSDCSIEPMSYIGLRAVIHSHIRLPAGSSIPRDAEIKTQEDVDTYVSSETIGLNRLREEMTELLARNNG